MTYAPPTVPLSASWVGAAAYSGSSSIIYAHWAGGNYITPAGNNELTLGTPFVTKQQFANHVGFDSAAFSPALVARGTDYIPPFRNLDAGWASAAQYEPPAIPLLVAWDSGPKVSQYLFAEPIDSLEMGEPNAIWAQIIAPVGLDGCIVGSPVVRPPPLNAAWLGALPYTPPAVMVYGWWGGIPAGSVFPAGWRSSVAGRPSIRNTAEQIRPPGIDSELAFGSHHAWNWRQYLLPGGLASQAFGAAFLSGGVKHVTLNGIASFASGSHTVINTTANQTIDLSLRGIAPVAVPSPAVSPRFVRPGAIYATGFGFPQLQFSPHPAGWQSSTFGYPVVADRTHYVSVGGIEAEGLGFPVVRDKAQTVYPHASPVTSVFGDVLVRLEKRYVYPEGYITQEFSDWSEVRNTRRPVYPAGQAHTAYGDHTVANKTPALWPAGIDSQSFGDADVGFYYRPVYPAGIIAPYPQVMPPSLWQTPGIRPTGIAATTIEKPNVWPAVRFVGAHSFESMRFGQATADFSWRRLRLEEHGIEAAEHGKPTVWLSLRVLEIGGSKSYMEFGTAWVSPGLRAVEPEGIDYPYMSNHMVGTTRYVGPEGWESTRWLTRIIPEHKLLEQMGRRSDVYGLARIENKTRSVFPEGITTYPEPFMHWGVAKVWNLRQIIQQFEDLESGLSPLPWSKWTLIENRNKTIRPSGFAATLFGYNLVSNNARAVLPTSINEPSLPEYQKTGSVTHWMRPLHMEGIEPPIVSGWSVVYNKAFPLKPAGLVVTEFGRAEVVNTRRYQKMVGFETYALGHAFVSFAIRELTFEGRYGIQPPPIQLPDVRLHTRYVDPPSIDQGRLGQEALVETRFNKIHPRWNHIRDLFGEAAVKNVTPEYLMRGWDTSEWGDTHVRLEWRDVQADGYDQQLFGKAIIADRKRTISTHGFDSMRVSDKLKFIRIGSDPIVTQYIDLRRFILDDNTGEIVSDEGEGYGISVPTAQVSAPNLLKGYIFHGMHNREMTLWGNPYVTANTIRVEPGYNELSSFGEHSVTAKIRTLEVKTIGQLVNDSVDSSGGRDMGSWGKPAISPHTIYAVLEAPAQAIRNHGINESTLRPVNAGARFGSPRLSQHLNTIHPKGITEYGPDGSWGVGRPSTHNMLQYIRPIGSLMQRLGWAVIPGERAIVLDDEDAVIGPSVFGRPSVQRPPDPPFVKGKGFTSYASGQHVIDFYHRTVKPQGLLSQAMGFSRGDTRNMPQSLHVGYPNLHQQVGFDASGYGEAWISHRVREVTTEGWDSFLCEYSLEHFDQRMRVWRTAIDIHPAQRVDPEGFDSHQVSAANVIPGLHFIRPDGNSDQYRKGAF